ncbi:secretion protein [Porphyromonas gulae]|uniref:T9SS-dependent choice-of-anchor J family protein n=1 Tax=Porphyromonas gulae TaxID=111105 RepID=UPI000367298E|nr:T9SS type A sorting domain-containing protein [Porphyromonas gulae]KGN78077.1 secretion protein [Porphyromonas gulae]
MKRIFAVLILSFCFHLIGFSQEALISTSFEGPGFDEGWTTGVSSAITKKPQPYPSSGLEAWEMWALTDPQGGFGFVHSGDSAAWIGGTLQWQPKHDWLMTPQFEVPNGGSTLIKFWLWYHSEANYVNKFYIMIYDYSKEAWEQGYLLANEFNSPFHYVEEYTFDLAQWKGKDIKVAFVKNGTYQMAMDDIRILNYQGLQEIEQAGIRIYPNPTTDRLMLDNVSDVTAIRIIDMYGRPVVVTANSGSSKLSIDVSNLGRGNYVVDMQCKGHRKISRLITKE